MLPEFIREYISNQFRKPTGLFGRYLEKGMSKRTTLDAEWTLSLLDIQPTSRLFEVGFGGGLAAQLAGRQAPRGFVAGIDHSDTMVRIASQRNKEAIREQRMELAQGDAGTVPYPDGSFDIVYSLHSIYFWKDAVECLKGFYRALKVGGLLAITIQPKNRWRDDQLVTPGMTFYVGEQIVDMFNTAGFKDVRMESYSDTEGVKLQCILGHR